MSSTVQFGLTTAYVKQRFNDTVQQEGSIAKAITSLMNRAILRTSKYRFQSLASNNCVIWEETIHAGRESLANLHNVLQMLDTYVTFNRLDSRSAALEELLLGISGEDKTEEVKEFTSRHSIEDAQHSFLFDPTSPRCNISSSTSVAESCNDTALPQQMCSPCVSAVSTQTSIDDHLVVLCKNASSQTTCSLKEAAIQTDYDYLSWTNEFKSDIPANVCLPQYQQNKLIRDILPKMPIKRLAPTKVKGSAKTRKKSLPNVAETVIEEESQFSKPSSTSNGSCNLTIASVTGATASTQPHLHSIASTEFQIQSVSSLNSGLTPNHTAGSLFICPNPNNPCGFPIRVPTMYSSKNSIIFHPKAIISPIQQLDSSHATVVSSTSKRNNLRSIQGITGKPSCQNSTGWNVKDEQLNSHVAKSQND